MKTKLPFAIFFIFLSHLFTINQTAYASSENIINFALSNSNTDPNHAYIYELVTLILKNTPKQYELKLSKNRLQQDRSIYEMTQNNGTVDLMWTMTTDQREKQMIPIRLPIDKGLIGWRVALIATKNKEIFQNINNLDNLSKFSAGQQRDWPDVGILQSNNLKVVTSNDYEPLFNMLMAGRFDYFPRSIFEYANELEQKKEKNMIADQHFVLVYPSATYFFVTPRRPKLAEDLRIGFEKIIENGSFEKLFLKYNQASIERADIRQRVKIQLKNPLLNPKSMPLNRPELWFFTPQKAN